jgi:PAS domain S-box-containing protein
MIGEPLRILLVEDVPEDAELVLLEVRRLGVDFLSQRVDTRDGLLEALQEFGPDLILCDYSMPSFDGLAALRLTREHSPGTPFIVVTGSLNEEIAVECMKEGAADYVLKDRMARLGPAVLAALERARAQREKELASTTLRESEARYRLLAENASDVIWTMDLEGRFSYMSPSVESLLGFHPEEARKRPLDEMLTPTSAAAAWAELRDAQAQAAAGKSVEPRRLELEMRRRDGSTVWTDVTVTAVLGPGGALTGAQGVARDISAWKRAQETLRGSETRYRELFEHTPIPVWEEDFSAVHAELAQLRSAGVDNFDSYLNEHPNEVARLASLIRIVDVNQTSVEYREQGRSLAPALRLLCGRLVARLSGRDCGARQRCDAVRCRDSDPDRIGRAADRSPPAVGRTRPRARPLARARVVPGRDGDQSDRGGTPPQRGQLAPTLRAGQRCHRRFRPGWGNGPGRQPAGVRGLRVLARRARRHKHETAHQGRPPR